MTYVDIELWRVSIAFALLLACGLGVSWHAGLDLGRVLLTGAVRAAAQLLAVGYALVLLFEHQRAEWVFGVIAIMLVTAAWTSASRVDGGPRRRELVLPAVAAIGVGSTVALVPVLAFVIMPTPWFDARYVVPISGMIVANSMNVVALVNERIFASARSERAEIEQWLALGATPRQAIARQTRDALRAGMIPTINGLLTVGLVSLPGMMTGQILSGTAPDSAVRYQLVILYQLVTVAAVSGAAAAYFARRMLFDARGRLRHGRAL